MFRPRLLSPGEAALRHATGSDDLTDHPDDWYVLAPRHDDEVYSVAALQLTISGEGLLDALDRLGNGAVLEIAVFEADRFGVAQDGTLAALVALEAAEDWRRGIHDGTVIDPEAGRRLDGAPRPALVGRSRTSPPSPNNAQWTSADIDLRYGRHIERAVWEIEGVRDRAGEDIDALRLEFMTGRHQGGGIDWDPSWTSLNVAGDQGRWFDPPLEADVIRCRVGLTYETPVDAAYHPMAARTQRVFMLGFWIRLEAPWWRFGSLARLLREAEKDPLLRSASWDGADVALLRLPLPVRLRKRHGERIAARIVGGADGLTLIRIEAVAEIGFAPLIGDV